MMTVLAVLTWPMMVFVFGFLPIGLALIGKADVPAALRTGIIPGIIGAIMAFWFWMAPDYVVSLILGAAAMVFLAVGFAGFVFKAEALPTIAHLVNYTGVILVILGLYVMYLFQALIPGLVAGLQVLLFGIAALAAGYSVLGKLKGGWYILGVVAINFILSFYLLVG
jgi:hypothetical protein